MLSSGTAAGAPVHAQTGSVTSSATPSNATPNIGQQVVVTIHIDMSNVAAPNDKLGSFTASLDWDPGVLAYNSNSGVLASFTGVVNAASAATGHIVFNGANAAGAAGNIIVLTITFDVVGAGTSALNLEYSAMTATITFADLLPILTVTDGQVVVGAVQHTLTPTPSPAAATPTLTPTVSHTATEVPTLTDTPVAPTPTLAPSAIPEATLTATLTSVSPTAPSLTAIPTSKRYWTYLPLLIKTVAHFQEHPPLPKALTRRAYSLDSFYFATAQQQTIPWRHKVAITYGQ